MDASSDRAPSPGELWDLFRTYLRQELIDPLRGTGRYLACGVAGSLLLAIGVVLVSLGVLRGLQAVETFGSRGLDLVPYVVTLVVLVVVVAIIVARIPRDSLHGRGR